MIKNFIGRFRELEKLKDLSPLKRACLVVIKGRRRVGKSSLATEYAQGKRLLSFSGLAPVDAVTDQDQRDTFAGQFAQNFHLPPLTFIDWSDAFNHLSLHIKKDEPTVLLLDEISWMGSKDPTFIPKLKIWWDLYGQHFPKLIVILCGSVSSWIEENILNSTAFFGRISLQIDLEELSLPECAELLRKKGFKGSAYDLFKILSITGGVPWYLEQISPEQTADANLLRLAFSKGGIFTLEFDKIFHDLFDSRGTAYRKIVHSLSEGMKDLDTIRKSIKHLKGGYLSEKVQALITSGFVSQHYSWSMKTGRLGKFSLHRLSDNYLRFYIKYIQPNLPKIEKKFYENFSLSQLVGWETMMGFQIENLLLKNRHLLLKALGLNPGDIVADNPYIQRPRSTRQKGCQIDYLIQTHAKNLYLCEFKFTKREIGPEILTEMKEKERRFSAPRGFAKVPVLFHLGSVADSVYESGYFYRIIDITEFLAPDLEHSP